MLQHSFCVLLPVYQRLLRFTTGRVFGFLADRCCYKHAATAARE